MNKEEEENLVNLFENLLDIYSVEELLEYSDWSQAELLTVLVDLEYLTLPNPLPTGLNDPT